MSLILSGTNGLSDVDGTAATPAIRGTDTNTGMFFPAADVVAFATAGTEDARFDSNGFFLVNTTTAGLSNSRSMVFQGTGDGSLYLNHSTLNTTGDQYLHFGYNGTRIGAISQFGTSGINLASSTDMLFTTNSSERMRIDSSGNVGIGTSSPGAKFEVVGQADFTTVVAAGNGVRIRTPSGSGSPAILQFTNNPVTSQWGYISASSADVMTIGGSAEFVRINGSNFQFNSGYGSVATAYGCRAWVNFNGTGTVAIRGSGNVSSITDLGVGSYQINIATAMPDANYTVVGASTSVVGIATTDVVTTFRRDTDVRVANTTTATTISTCNSNNSTALDCVDVNISIFR